MLKNPVSQVRANGVFLLWWSNTYVLQIDSAPPKFPKEYMFMLVTPASYLLSASNEEYVIMSGMESIIIIIIMHMSCNRTLKYECMP